MTDIEAISFGITFGVILPFAIWAIITMKNATHNSIDDLD